MKGEDFVFYMGLKLMKLVFVENNKSYRISCAAISQNEGNNINLFNKNESEQMKKNGLIVWAFSHLPCSL